MAIGASLKQARERRGISIEEAAAASHIPAHYIVALEADAFDDIPAPAYVRGFLRVYSRLLEIDTAALLDELVLVWPAAMIPPPPVSSPALTPPPEPAAWEVPDLAGSPPAPLPHRRVISDIEDDWEPEFEPVVRVRGSHGPSRERSGHSEGVLSEREPAEHIRLPDRRLVVLGAAVVMVMVLLLGAAILRGGGTANNPAVPSPIANRTIQPGTEITIGSPTATVSATPSSSAGGVPAASQTAAAATGAAAPTATPVP